MTDEELIDEDSLIANRLPTAIEMRKMLQFYFMNPVEKWYSKRRFPYKLLVQIIKIVLVTLQIYLFAINRSTHIEFSWNSRFTFSHLFLKQWDTTREIVAYPPDQGALAIYKIDEFYDTVDFAYKNYIAINSTIGPYFYTGEKNEMMPPKLCFSRFQEAIIFGYNESYIFNPEINKTCIFFDKESFINKKTKGFLEQYPEFNDFQSMITTEMIFGLKTINLKESGPLRPPECYKFIITIEFDNSNHDGQILLRLDADTYRLDCKGDRVIIARVTTIEQIFQFLLDYLVIILCLLSFVLCIRALLRARQLMVLTKNFFRNKLHKELSVAGQRQFVNYWYIMMVVNDVCIVIGSTMKQRIEKSKFASNEWNLCGLFLGIGNLLVWIGVLRYFGFFKTYNVLILTLKLALPNVARFLICVLLIYSGFTFCGWLVLGPYNLKFRSLSLTSECLFSLINGDDMFATFTTTLSSRSLIIWWFSRIYLYSFIGLFIYVVLSVFISIILDSYETIKLYEKKGFPKTDLKEFIGEKIPLDQFEEYNSTVNDNRCSNFYRLLRIFKF